MAGTQASEGATIVEPDDQRRLHQACPDLEDWPQAWHIEPEDITVGEAILIELKPFLLHLLDQGLARSTFRRHRDNVGMLAAALIHRRYDDDELAAMPVDQALRHLVQYDEAPLMWAGITESEQRTFDTTARKLNQFLQHDEQASSSTAPKVQRRHGGDRTTPKTQKSGRRRGGA